MKILVLILAIAMVESGGDVNAVNEAEDAVGYLQIRPCCVEDVNRILGEEKFTLADRYSKEKSIEMFKVYTAYYYVHYSDDIKKAGISKEEAMARIWNGGPRGWKYKSTKGYWKKVKANIKEDE